MGSTVIHSNLPIDEHPNIVVTAEGKFLVFLIGKGCMRFEAPLLVTGNTRPILTSSPIPYSGIITVKERMRRVCQPITVKGAGPSLGSTILVKISSVAGGHRRFSLALGSALVAGLRTYGLYSCCGSLQFKRIKATRIPPACKFVSRKVIMGRIRIESPTGVRAVMSKLHVITLNFIFSRSIVKERFEFSFRTSACCGICISCVKDEHLCTHRNLRYSGQKKIDYLHFHRSHRLLRQG